MGFSIASTRAAGFAFAAGLATIAAAWGFQVIGGFVPCKLCLEERWAYYAGLPLLLAGLLIAGRALGPARLLFALAGVVFLAGAGLAIYHAGAEWNFWPGPTDCGGGVGPVTDAGNLLAAMQHTRLVSCTEASFRLFGLSFAGWNVVMSLLVALACLRAATAGRDARF